LLTSSAAQSPEKQLVTGSVTVGVVANPASGRDIRRLVAGASVFDNAEKGNMVYRFMVGLGAVGVERVLMMPAASGLYDGLERTLHGRAFETHPLPELELVEMRLRHDARDTVEALEKMREQGVKAIAVFGGDGTNRVVASRCTDTPICALSTGTNNTFPEMREATVAGLATGLVATGQVDNGVLRQEKILHVGLNSDPHHDCALVDVAVSSERFVAARALWKSNSVSQLFVASAAPDAVGFSAVAGLLDPISRHAHHGLYLRLTEPGDAALVLNVPLAPGLVVPIGVAESTRMEPGSAVPVKPGSGSIALDGEREIERGPEDRVEVSLATEGPLTIDIGEVMSLAARHGLLSDQTLSKKAAEPRGFAPTEAKRPSNQQSVTGL
jgi:predicted polyphosphate/ATP-dependent NAD kinase